MPNQFISYLYFNKFLEESLLSCDNIFRGLFRQNEFAWCLLIVLYANVVHEFQSYYDILWFHNVWKIFNFNFFVHIFSDRLVIHAGLVNLSLTRSGKSNKSINQQKCVLAFYYSFSFFISSMESYYFCPKIRYFLYLSICYFLE